MLVVGIPNHNLGMIAATLNRQALETPILIHDPNNIIERPKVNEFGLTEEKMAKIMKDLTTPPKF